MPLGEQRGGGEQMLLDLLREGRGRGISWSVLFLEEGPMVEQVKALDIDVQVLHGGRLRQAHLFVPTVLKIASIARADGTALIFGWMWKAHLYGGPAALLARLPAMWFQLEEPSDSNVMKRIANLVPARGVVTLSKAGQEAQAGIWPHRPAPLVYPGAFLDRFDPSVLPSPLEARRLLGLPLHVPLIGIVGRLQRWKGIHVLVDAMPAVLEKHPDARFLVVGGKHDLEPDYEIHLRERITALGLADRIIMAGQQQDVPTWMQAMDVFVHASENEPFGIVTVEAMALGKPVVAGASGGPTEIITDGENGLLTPYGDADALAGAIVRYLDDPEFAGSVGRAAQTRAADFSSRRYAQNFISAVRAACGVR